MHLILDLFTLDRLRSRKDVREVGLTSFRLFKRPSNGSARGCIINSYKHEPFTCDVASYYKDIFTKKRTSGF
jgi:hypothetical protein